jgi:hypothetical protein
MPVAKALKRDRGQVARSVRGQHRAVQAPSQHHLTSWWAVHSGLFTLACFSCMIFLTSGGGNRHRHHVYKDDRRSRRRSQSSRPKARLGEIAVTLGSAPFLVAIRCYHHFLHHWHSYTPHKTLVHKCTIRLHGHACASTRELVVYVCVWQAGRQVRDEEGITGGSGGQARGLQQPSRSEDATCKGGRERDSAAGARQTPLGD